MWLKVERKFVLNLGRKEGRHEGSFLLFCGSQLWKIFNDGLKIWTSCPCWCFPRFSPSQTIFTIFAKLATDLGIYFLSSPLKKAHFIKLILKGVCECMDGKLRSPSIRYNSKIKHTTLQIKCIHLSISPKSYTVFLETPFGTVGSIAV